MPASTSISTRPAILPWAGRSSTPPLWRRRNNAIPTPRRPTSRRARYRRRGRASRPSCARRIVTHAGRSSSPRQRQRRDAEDKAARHRRFRLRLQEPCLDRPPARLHPWLERHECTGMGWRAASQCSQSGQHRIDGMGGHRLPLEGERGVAGKERLLLRHPPQEAEGPADECANCARQRTPVQDPRLRRARLRETEISHGPVRAHDRHRPGEDEDRHGQSRLQSHPLFLSPGANRASMTAQAPQNADAAPKSALGVRHND